MDRKQIFPVHPNPDVGPNAQEILGGMENVSLSAPLNYGEMVWLLNFSQFILTDSGGVQEEAPTLGKPVLILRETTERQESVDAGCGKLVGYDSNEIQAGMEKLIDKKSAFFKAMAQATNPYGDGTSSARIVSIL